METAPDLSPPPGEKPPTIVIVGGGFTGAAAAIALLTGSRHPFQLKIVDPGRKLGAGLAYGAARSGDLLNVRSEDMRLRADAPHDFNCWLAGEDLIDDGAWPPFSFYAPRHVFGAYVRSGLSMAIASRSDVDVEHVRLAATGVGRGERARFIVRLQGGGAIDADHVIIAAGYGLPKPARFGYGAYEDIEPAALRRARTAAIAGSGLSAIDAALQLAAAAPHLRIRLISRRSLRPLTQNPGPALSTPWAEPLPTTARATLAAVRRRVLDAASEGKDWRAVLNGLRPVTQDIWIGFSSREKRRFARHLKPYWDVIRHRMPAKTAQRIAELERRGRLTFEAGMVRPGAGGEIEWRARGADTFEPLSDDIVIDCTGHRPDLEAPVVQSMIAEGLAAPDALGLGVAVDQVGRVLARRLAPTPGLFALGPVGAGSLLEITATAEIAQQAAAAADQIISDIGAAAFATHLSDASTTYRSANAR